MKNEFSTCMEDLTNCNKHFDELIHHLNVLASEMVRQSQLSQMENLSEIDGPEADFNTERISKKRDEENEQSA
ncbi:MAG: hypothetical protein P1U56_14360 [Saprospiraceae bacterium]|nr:hypothetical protein [Saprospiraceae bacterium]